MIYLSLNIFYQTKKKIFFKAYKKIILKIIEIYIEKKICKK